MRRRHLYGVVLGILLAVGFAIWQPWRGSQLEPPQAHTLVLLSIDALRRDHVGAYAPSEAAARAATPRLNALAADSVRFDDARTMVPLTLPSHTTMLSGLSPAQTGVRVNAQPLAPVKRRHFPLIQEALRRAGWRTGAFVSAETLHPKYGLGAGFEVYDAEGLDPGAAGGLSVPERAGEDTVDAALRFVASVGSDERLFLFIHLFEPHAPYHPSYRADCEDADRIVSRLLDGLRGQGRGSASLIVTADHGEALGELGEKTHGVLLSDGVMRVPLLLHVPGRRPGVRSDPVTVGDIAPTLAALAGIHWTSPPDAWASRSLLGAPLPADRPRVAESLYGHHRFRWAQLSAAVLPSGQLVDAGTGRAHWLPVQPFGQDLLGPAPASTAPDDPALFASLGGYRSSEEAAAMSAASGITGYGAGGDVTPFLPGPENARLPDPYTLVSNADVLSALAARTAAASTQADLKRISAALRRMAAVDPGNPEVWFRLGRAAHGLALRQRQADGAGRRAGAAAEDAFRRAWQAGRRDEGTLVLWVGANAIGREADMCARLDTYGKQVGEWTFQLWLLKAILLRARQEAGEPGLDTLRAEACREAAARAHTPREAGRLTAAGCR